MIDVVRRDVSEDIRASAIGAIGQWIKLLPSMFLVDNYLKYLAWALSDKACRVSANLSLPLRHATSLLLAFCCLAHFFLEDAKPHVHVMTLLWGV